MPNPHDPQESEPDPFIYANMMNGFMMDRNPLQTIWGDFSRMVLVMANLGKTRKLAQLRLEHLQQQLAKVEEDIASVNPQHMGTRLNKLR
jgi:hypothetical protein